MKYLSNPYFLYQDQIKQLYYIYSKNIVPNSIIFSSKESEITKNIMNSFAMLLTEEKSIHTFDEFCNEIFKKEIVQSPYIYFVERDYLDDKKRLKEKIFRADINFIHDFFSVKDDLGQKRICVVDSIDDLSEDASNSLLKIIEEPTKNSHFLFLNQSKSKLLDTISSRSRILNFGKIPKDTFVRTFKNDGISVDFLHNLTHGSIQLAKNFNDYNFNEIKDHFISILHDKNKIKANTFDHYMKFINLNTDKNFNLKLFFEYLMLIVNMEVKNVSKEKGKSVIFRLLNIYDILLKMKNKSEIFNLDRENILISLFYRIKNV